jgi:GT2 family glycosyltransferase
MQIMSAPPMVSIIIVNLNGVALTESCIRSVCAHTAPGTFEIVIVDNGSSPAEIEQLSRLSQGDITLILLGRNLFFGEANNIGVERARGEYIVLLNNDAEVTAGWLERLMAVLRGEPAAGAVGPRFLYPDGRLQEAGAFIRPDGYSLQQGKAGTAPPSSFHETPQPVDYCSAACLLMRRRHFLELGGFDPLYEPAYYEDVDLALRLRSIGLLTYYCGEAIVAHHENATSNAMWTVKRFEELISQSHGRFAKRWGGYLKARMAQECEPAPLPALHWQAEPEIVAPNAIALHLNEPLTLNDISKSFLEVASALSEICPVMLVFDNIYSRCRVYSLCRHYRIILTHFCLESKEYFIKARLYEFGKFIDISLGGRTDLARANANELAQLLSEFDNLPIC